MRPSKRGEVISGSQLRIANEDKSRRVIQLDVVLELISGRSEDGSSEEVHVYWIAMARGI